jgi:hypothetical protein
VVAGSGGRLFVLDGQLNEYLDHDGNPETIEPFLTGQFDGAPLEWIGPPAVGDFFGDENLEILLTSSSGVFAYDHEGQGVAFTPAPSPGLIAYSLAENWLGAPLFVPAWGDSLGIISWYTEGGETRLAQGGYSNLFGSWEFFHRSLGQLEVAGSPAAGWEHLFVALRDTLGSNHVLRVMGVDLDDHFDVALPMAPGDLPLSLGLVRPADPENSLRYVVLADEAGHPYTILFDADLDRVGDVLDGGGRVSLDGPLVAGGATVGDGYLGRLGHNGEWLDGWPVRPDVGFDPSPWHSAPLVCRLLDAASDLDHFLFPAGDGRVYALGTRGEMVSGWPLAGPAESAATPALGDLDGDGNLELVALGVFDRISGLDEGGESLTSTTVASLKVWTMWPRAPCGPCGAALPCATATGTWPPGSRLPGRPSAAVW